MRNIIVDDLVNDLVDDLVDNIVNNLVNDFVDNLADDFVDDFVNNLADDLVNDLFMNDSSFNVLRKKNVSKLAKSVFKRSTISFTFVYLLHVQVLYENNVIFEIFFSHHVNFTTKKRFFLRSFINEMTAKIKIHINERHLICHLISLKVIVI
jgi:hypothetical protein